MYLTDLPYTLDNLKECIKLNKAALKGEVVAEPLDWYGGEQGMERGWQERRGRWRWRAAASSVVNHEAHLQSLCVS